MGPRSMPRPSPCWASWGLPRVLWPTSSPPARQAGASSAARGPAPDLPQSRAERAQRVAGKLLDGFLLSGVKEERSFGAVALLCLLTFCGHSPQLQRLLPSIQVRTKS